MNERKKVVKIPLVPLIIIILCIIGIITVPIGNKLIMSVAKYSVTNSTTLEGDTYYINTSEDLWDFAENVNNGNTFEGTTVYLTADINLECSEDNQWIPIGKCYVDAGNYAVDTTEKEPFCGTFEGNNHTISGIYIDTESNYAGLFGYNQGTIQNLKLKDSYIKSNKAYIGGISAFNIGTIKNCHNSANVVSETSSGACGGITGFSHGANIIQCSNEGKIEGENGYIAGISGYAWATKINNCANKGDVVNNETTAAGIVAFCQTSWLEKCYNTGNIKGSYECGGITGCICRFASISNCYNTGTISNSAESASEKIYTGGITGTANLSIGDQYKIINCYSSGKIIKNSISEETTIYAGNLIGVHEAGSIENCYYEKNEILGVGTDLIENCTEDITELETADMKNLQLVENLNNDEEIYYYDEDNINKGYPILDWQYLVVKSDVYDVKRVEGYITKIQPGTKVSELKEKIETNAEEIKIYTKDNKELEENEIIGTGMHMVIKYMGQTKTFVLGVKGDADGDGDIGISDLAKINAHRLKKKTLEEANLMAADVDDNGTIDLTDLSKVNRFRLHKSTQL